MAFALHPPVGRPLSKEGKNDGPLLASIIAARVPREEGGKDQKVRGGKGGGGECSGAENSCFPITKRKS